MKVSFILFFLFFIPSYHLEPKSSSLLNFPIIEKNEIELKESFEKLLNLIQKTEKEIVSGDIKTKNFQNVAVALDKTLHEARSLSNRTHLLKLLSTDASLRKLAQDYYLKVDEEVMNLQSKPEIYKILIHLQTLPSFKHLSEQDKRMLRKLLGNFRRLGISLSSPIQDEVKKVKKEIALLESQISKNFQEKNSKIYTLKDEDIDSLPPSIRKIFLTKKGKYVFHIGVLSEYVTLMENIKSEEIRKKFFFIKYGSYPGNTKILSLMTECVRKRALLSRLMGYRSWASYATEIRMVKTEENAQKFILNLKNKLDLPFKAEIKKYLQLKIKDSSQKEAKLEPWDIYYYQKAYNKELGLDDEEIKLYFELNKVLNNLFRLIEQVFSLKIEEVTPPYVWHPEIKVIKISDATYGGPLGYLYLDLYVRPTDEKFNNSALFHIKDGIEKDGIYERPSAALICNFSPSQENPKKVYLTPLQVKNLFHEMGHALHLLLTQVKYGLASGTFTGRDFVEVPSQFLESWAMDPSILSHISSLPKEKISLLVQSYSSQMAVYYRRQLALSAIDLAIHSKEIDPNRPIDLVKIAQEIFKEYYIAWPSDSSFITNFAHPFNGYDSAYYGYVWSLYLASNIVNSFEESPLGLLDREKGRKLRKEIFEVGGARDEGESLKLFLGRPPTLEAMILRLGVRDG